MRHLAILTFALVIAPITNEVPGQPPRPASVADGQFDTAVNRWSSQIVLEAQQLHVALAASPIPRVRELARAVEQLQNQATQFYRFAKTPGNRDRLRREFQPLDQSLTSIVNTVRAVAKAERQPALLPAASQLEYAGEQLGFWLAKGDDAIDSRRAWLIRQTRILDNQSDELQRTLQDVVRGASSLRQSASATKSFVADVDRLRQAAEGKESWEQVESAFDTMARSWFKFWATLNNLTLGLSGRSPLPPGQFGVRSLVPPDSNVAAQIGSQLNRPYLNGNDSAEFDRQLSRINQLIQNMATFLGRAIPAVTRPQGGGVPGRTTGPVTFDSPYAPTGLGPGLVSGWGSTGLPRRPEFYAIGADAGGGPHVRVFHSRRANDFASFYAYDPEFKGGVRVAVGDITSEGVPDLVTAPGPGMPPLIRIFDGRDMSPIRQFLAFDAPYQQGCWVAAGDIRKDRQAEIVVGTGEGVPARVRIFDATGRALGDLIPYEPNFQGGVHVALGDINGDGVMDIITTPGPGRPITVRIFDGRNLTNVLGQFDAYDPRFQGGAFVAAANLRGDGRAEIVTGAGAGGGPHVRVFTGPRGQLAFEFFPYDQQFRGGVRVACRDVNGDGVPDIITTPGPGVAPIVRAFDGTTQQRIFEFSAFDPLFQGGAFVGSR